MVSVVSEVSKAASYLADSGQYFGQKPQNPETSTDLRMRYEGKSKQEKTPHEQS